MEANDSQFVCAGAKLQVAADDLGLGKEFPALPRHLSSTENPDCDSTALSLQPARYQP